MRILSGIQPSGTLHLGNYFGMMRPAIELQDQGEAYYFIANYHSMTSLYDAEARRKNTLDVALDFLACGLDPKKADIVNPVCDPGILVLPLHTIPAGQNCPEIAGGRKTARPVRQSRQVGCDG